MADETEILKKSDLPAGTTQEKTETVKYTVGAVSPDSRIFGVSVMAWVFLILTLTVCGLNVFQIPIYDHLVTISLMIASFYAGQRAAK